MAYYKTLSANAAAYSFRESQAPAPARAPVMSSSKGVVFDLDRMKASLSTQSYVVPEDMSMDELDAELLRVAAQA